MSHDEGCRQNLVIWTLPNGNAFTSTVAVQKEVFKMEVLTGR